MLSNLWFIFSVMSNPFLLSAKLELAAKMPFFTGFKYRLRFPNILGAYEVN